MHWLKSLIAANLLVVLTASVSPPAFAGMCEEQLDIPWRRAVAAGKLPLNIPFHLNPDGTNGVGSPNAVIDRPFYNVFQKGGYILFTGDTAEMFFETNNQGYIPQCEGVPFSGITINGKVAKVEHLLTAKPYMNLSRLSPEAIQLIRDSNGEAMEFLTAIGRRIPIGSKTVSSLKRLYDGFK